MDLQGSVALVTGGAVRLGRAIALGLAEAGSHVVVHYHRSVGPAEDTTAAARCLGVEAVAHPADLADPDAARALVRAALERFGRVDILVHSASPFALGGLRDTTPETWRQVMGVLVDSLFHMAQELAPGMVEGGGGSIVALLDRGAFDAWPKFLAHGVGKSALWALIRHLAVALAPHVRANAVVPGPVLRPPGYSPEQEARIAAETLLGRWGRPQDVVDAVTFLIRSDYVTGEALFVDGGERWAHRKATVAPAS